MAYVREKIIIDLHYDDYFPGLNVSTVEPSGNLWEEVIIPRLKEERDKEEPDPLQFVDIFVMCLDSWDLKRSDGTSVPCTRKGLMEHDLDFVKIIIRHWLNEGIVVARNKYGHLLSTEDTPSESALTDMPVEVVTDDPLRQWASSAVDVVDLPVPEEVSS